MNKLMLLLLMIFGFQVTSNAQYIDGTGNLNDFGFILVTKTADLSKVEGTPYLNEEFQSGTLHIDGKDPLPVFLRYDVVNERMEVKPKKNIEETYMLPRNQTAQYMIGEKRYVLDKINTPDQTLYGYFLELYEGDNYRLLKKPMATLTEPVRAKTGYEKDRPARIEMEETYFVVGNNGKAQEVELKNRKIKKSFSSSEAKDYLNDHKIRSEEDLVAFISFLDQQN